MLTATISAVNSSTASTPPALYVNKTNGIQWCIENYTGNSCSTSAFCSRDATKKKTVSFKSWQFSEVSPPCCIRGLKHVPSFPYKTISSPQHRKPPRPQKKTQRAWGWTRPQRASVYFCTVTVQAWAKLLQLSRCGANWLHRLTNTG